MNISNFLIVLLMLFIGWICSPYLVSLNQSDNDWRVLKSKSSDHQMLINTYLDCKSSFPWGSDQSECLIRTNEVASVVGIAKDTSSIILKEIAEKEAGIK